jgi:hypothetical protein
MCSLAGGSDGTLESMRSKWRLEPEAEALGSDAATGESTVDGNGEGEGWKLEPGCIDDAFEGRSGVGCTNGEAGVVEGDELRGGGGSTPVGDEVQEPALLPAQASPIPRRCGFWISRPEVREPGVGVGSRGGLA